MKWKLLISSINTSTSRPLFLLTQIAAKIPLKGGSITVGLENAQFHRNSFSASNVLKLKHFFFHLVFI